MLMQGRVVMNLDVLYHIITLISHDERDAERTVVAAL